MTVSGPETYSFRGQERTTHAIRYEQSNEKSIVLRITPEREILAIEFEETPIALIAGTEEEIAENIAADGPEAGPRSVDSPVTAVTIYFRVLSKEAPTEALDGVMNWEAIHAEMAAKDDDIARLTPEIFASVMKGQFEGQRGVVTEEQVDLIIPMLKTEIDGNAAKIALPGRDDDPFLLKKGDDGWKITHFPH
jgi:hypothetical protein